MTNWMIALFGGGCWLAGVAFGLNWWKFEARRYERSLVRKYGAMFTPQRRP